MTYRYQGGNGPSTSVIVAGIVVFGAFGLAAVLFVSPGPEATQRLGILFALFGTAVAALVAALKSSTAASNTNGKLDARIEAGVHRAMAARRRGDEPLTPGQLEGVEPLTPDQARSQGVM